MKPLNVVLRELYVERGLSTRQIASAVGIHRLQVARFLRESGVDLPLRGRGRARPTRRLPHRDDLACILHELYVCRRLTSKEIGARLGMSQRTIRNRLREFGIPVRTRGWANREDRKSFPVDVVASMYLDEGRSSKEIARQLGTSCHAVLRIAHDYGWPVRVGGPSPKAGPTEIELIEALYADAHVAEVLSRHGIPRVPPGAAIWRRFPVPIPLTCELLRELYADCGLGTYHIELLTGQPAMTVARHLRRSGITLRSPGGRTPFLRRWRRAA